jgi:hypothetical protein
MANETKSTSAYTARVVSRTTEPVNRRLRTWAFLEGHKLQVALTEALMRGLPSDDEIASRLAGGGQNGAGDGHDH